MEYAACASKVWPPCLLALAIMSAALTGCSASPSTGTVTGTVYFSRVTQAALTLNANVVAWRGDGQIVKAPLRRKGGWIAFAPGSGPAPVGTYRLTLAPGRYVMEIGPSPPTGDVTENVVVVRAGATTKKDFYVAFHASPVMSATTTPLRPYGLAVSRTGVLYVADVGRDQVLRYNANGTFTVVAGDGRSGFSGDGGPATQAELRLQWQSGLTVGADGTLYIADTGNERVRAVSPQGTISTVLGDGRAGGPPTSTTATEASIGQVDGLAIGPDGNLYAAVEKGIVQLMPGGTIDWAAGTVTPSLLPACGSMCNPAGESDFAGIDSLAFDSKGDLFGSGGAGTFAVYEVAPGSLPMAGETATYVGHFRGDGGPPALAETPGGTLVMSYRGGIVGLTVSGATTPITSLIGVLGINGGGEPNTFIGGDGLAVGPDGSIYVDTNVGNAWTSVSAVIRVSGAGASPTVLWES